MNIRITSVFGLSAVTLAVVRLMTLGAGVSSGDWIRPLSPNLSQPHSSATARSGTAAARAASAVTSGASRSSATATNWAS